MTYLVSNLMWTTIEMIAIGSSLYICDIEQKLWLYRWTLGACRFVYNLFHKDPLPEKIHLIYRAGIRSWVRVATALMFAEPVLGYLSWYFVGTRFPELRVEGFTMLPHLLGVLFGFYIGPIVNYFFQRREKLIDVIEKMEKEGIGGQVKQVTEAATEGIRHMIMHEKTIEESPKVEEPKFDPNKVIKDFGKRRRSS